MANVCVATAGKRPRGAATVTADSKARRFFRSYHLMPRLLNVDAEALRVVSPFWHLNAVGLRPCQFLMSAETTTLLPTTFSAVTTAHATLARKGPAPVFRFCSQADDRKTANGRDVSGQGEYRNRTTYARQLRKLETHDNADSAGDSYGATDSESRSFITAFAGG